MKSPCISASTADLSFQDERPVASSAAGSASRNRRTKTSRGRSASITLARQKNAAASGNSRPASEHLLDVVGQQLVVVVQQVDEVGVGGVQAPVPVAGHAEVAVVRR